ncbi:hypothetical protein M422DRAFT_98998, partial [Sphaerobolus stellatus SS14]
MPKNLFSIPIFFIVFRETLEAAIIVSVLLGLVEQIVTPSTSTTPPPTLHTLPAGPSTPTDEKDDKASGSGSGPNDAGAVDAVELAALDDPERSKRLIKKLRWQIFLGAASGLLVALAIGAAFIAVWFTQAADLWAKSENLWEGIFSLVACILIFVMALTMLKLDRAKTKWKVKLQNAFEGKHIDREGRTGKWVLFILPFITVLREGMEAVVFVGGVSLGEPATSIPIAAIVGILCGLICGFLIYFFASRTTLSIFLVVMTNFLLLIGAGLFSKSVGFFEAHAFTKIVGADVDDLGGDGPGSFRVRWNVWHINCCNPENNSDDSGWSIFSALFGWTNSATVGTILSYVGYWLAVIVSLFYLKWKEGRTTFFGIESKLGRARRERR